LIEGTTYLLPKVLGMILSFCCCLVLSRTGPKFLVLNL